MIITIGRQYGSGGHEIGKKLAEKLGVPFYDKELLARAAKESGYCEELIVSQDERPTSSFLYNLVMDAYSFGSSGPARTELPMGQKVFLAQFDAIKKIAEEGPCVIVGRCADYALEDRDDVFSVFISADPEFRLSRIIEVKGVPEDKAEGLMNKTDRQRQSYYNFYTVRKWGMASNYDLTVSSSKLGIDGVVNLLAATVQALEK